MPRAVLGSDHRLGLVDLAKDLNERLLLDPLSGGVEQQVDVDVGSLPDPVLVGKIPVGDDACSLQLGERAVGAVAGEGQDRP